MAKLKITSKQYKTLMETARRDPCCVRCSGCAGFGPDAGGVRQVGRPGAVTSEYDGVTAEMVLGLGVGANVLLGGRYRLNVAAGIAAAVGPVTIK